MFPPMLCTCCRINNSSCWAALHLLLLRRPSFVTRVCGRCDLNRLFSSPPPSFHPSHLPALCQVAELWPDLLLSPTNAAHSTSIFRGVITAASQALVLLKSLGLNITNRLLNSNVEPHFFSPAISFFLSKYTSTWLLICSSSILSHYCSVFFIFIWNAINIAVFKVLINQTSCQFLSACCFFFFLLQRWSAAALHSTGCSWIWPPAPNVSDSYYLQAH